MKTQPLTAILAAVALSIASSCQKQNSAALPPAPTVNAGTSQSVKLPVDSALLSGSAADAASRISGYIWSEISGPNTATIADDGSPVTEVKNLTAGFYVFQLMATDSLGLTGVDTVSVTVIQRDPITDTLRTLFPATSFSPYETMFLGNASMPQGNSASPELLAETWTINGLAVYGRSFFQFNMTSIPAGT